MKEYYDRDLPLNEVAVQLCLDDFLSEYDRTDNRTFLDARNRQQYVEIACNTGLSPAEVANLERNVRDLKQLYVSEYGVPGDWATNVPKELRETADEIRAIEAFLENPRHFTFPTAEETERELRRREYVKYGWDWEAFLLTQDPACQEN